MPSAEPTTLTEEYAELIEPLLPLAQKAFGSRDRVSPEHDASREYTALLVEFQEKGGSLNELATRLGVTYAGVRRRVRDASLTSSAASFTPRADRTAAYASVLAEHAVKISDLRANEAPAEEYHQAVLEAYDAGVPLTYLATELGLSSTGALYYALNAARARNQISA